MIENELVYGSIKATTTSNYCDYYNDTSNKAL